MLFVQLNDIKLVHGYACNATMYRIKQFQLFGIAYREYQIIPMT